MAQPSSRPKIFGHVVRLDFASLAQGGVALVLACTVAYLISG